MSMRRKRARKEGRGRDEEIERRGERARKREKD